MSNDNAPIVREMRQTFERNGQIKQRLSQAGMLSTPYQRDEFNRTQELNVLCCFLANTKFKDGGITKDRLDTYAARFGGEGRIIEGGWMLERETWSARPDEPSWKLSIAP